MKFHLLPRQARLNLTCFGSKGRFEFCSPPPQPTEQVKHLLFRRRLKLWDEKISFLFDPNRKHLAKIEPN